MNKIPKLKKIPKEIIFNNHKRVDNYFWLREKENPEVIKYLKAENKYTEEEMRGEKKLQKKLFTEIRSRIKEDDSSLPIKIGKYFYYTKTEKNKEHPIHCRKKESLKNKEEIIFDLNKISKNKKNIHLGVFEISPDHKMLAYSLDEKGDEKYTIYIKNLETGKLFSDKIINTEHGLEWDNNQSFYYTIADEVKRPHQIYKHFLGQKQKDDTLIFHGKDEAFFVGISKSRDQKIIFINTNSKTTSEIFYLKTNQKKPKVEKILPKEKGVEYFTDHHEGSFYILTNKNAKNFKLLKMNEKKEITEIIHHNKKDTLEGFDLFRDYLVYYKRVNGLVKIFGQNLKTKKEFHIPIKEDSYYLSVSENPNFKTNTFRFSYSSLKTPTTIFEYNFKNQKLEIKKEYQVLGDYNKNNYQTERIFATSKDGQKIPISLIYNKSLFKKNGKNPLYLTGYGAYGYKNDPFFSSIKLSLLDRGFVFAIAHVRGGGDMGRSWYEDGKFLHKKNTFTDFIDCAKELIKKKYTSKNNIVAQGGSAGGLLMGAVLNLNSELFKTVILEVPFVDTLNTMIDPSIPLTIFEYEEWGNPDDKKYYDYILSYSPYDNLKKKKYPNILVTAGLNDPRVHYWEPAKFVAKLRTLKKDKNLLLLKTDMHSGHSGLSGRYDYLKEKSFIYSFILKTLNIKK